LGAVDVLETAVISLISLQKLVLPLTLTLSLRERGLCSLSLRERAGVRVNL
jgi:hypothetical protein